MSTNPLRPELKWNRFDTLVALTVALLAIVSALLFYLPKTGGGDQLTLVITVGGTVHRVPAGAGGHLAGGRGHPGHAGRDRGVTA